MPRNLSADSQRWRLLTPLIKDNKDKDKYKIFVKNSHLKSIRDFVFEKTKGLPRYVKRRLIRHYTVLFNKKRHKGENNELFANIWLRDVVMPVNQILENCPLRSVATPKCIPPEAYDEYEKKDEDDKTEKHYSSAKSFSDKYFYRLLKNDDLIKELSKNTTQECVDIVSLSGLTDIYEENLAFAYNELVKYCKDWGITAPYSTRIDKIKADIAKNHLKPCSKRLPLEDIEKLEEFIVRLRERGVLRMHCEKWWYRKLKRIKDQTNEHILIVIGEVQKKISPYVSAQALQEWKNQQKANRSYLESMELVKSCSNENGDEWEYVPTITYMDEKGHEQVRNATLADFADASSSNPRNRFIELMVRCKGLENLALDDGYIGLFLTITSPSKYHASAKGESNPKYIGVTPKQTQAFLVNQWAKTRAELARAEIPFYGVRVVEPHHDATPHWHMLLFVHPADQDQLLDICESYALSVDGDEDGAQKHRFTVEEIDPNKGSATGYIAKYLSKNINGEYVQKGEDVEDYDSGKSASEGAKRATAWASRWSIRQFQFFGAESITIYRETRRLKDVVEDAEIEAVRQACESVDEKGKWYAFTKAMQEHRINLAKELHENNYSELVPKIKGLVSSTGKIITRDSDYVLRKSGSDSPWSPVNNCTVSKSEATKLTRLFSSDEIDLLFKGCRIDKGNGIVCQYIDGQLVTFRLGRKVKSQAVGKFTT